MSKPDADAEPPPERRPDPEWDEPGWVEPVARAAGALGLNQVRVRWKLRNLALRWHRTWRSSGRRLEHATYAHKTCSHCTAVQDRDARVCSVCGRKLSSRTWQVLERLGIASPRLLSASGLLGAAFVLIYGRLVVAGGGGGEAIVSLSPVVLVDFGGHWPPLVDDGEHWRWITACFLHAGLWHIGFNLFALVVVGPYVEELFDRGWMLLLFFVTGIAANAASYYLGLDGVGIGASGGLMGLVGVVAGWGQREGTTRGRHVRNDMLKWSLYVVFFGFLIGADNVAHLAGLAIGAAIGFVLRPRWLRREGWAGYLPALLGVAAVAATTTFIMLGASWG